MRSMVEGACGGSVRSSDRASVAAHAPSTALSAVPFPALRGRMGDIMRRKLSAPEWRFPRADDVQAMERAAVSRAARLSGAGTMHAVGILARLHQRALPPRAALPRAAAVLLGAQAGDAAGRMGEGGSRLPAAACAVVARLPQRLGRPVAVLNSLIRPRAQRGEGDRAIARWRGHAAVRAFLSRRSKRPPPRASPSPLAGLRAAYPFAMLPAGRGSEFAIRRWCATSEQHRCDG